MERNRYKVKHCIQTCSACPSQWDIYTEDGEYIYARYRWGYLMLTLNPFRGEKRLYTEQIGGNFDGVLDTLELVEHTRTILDWSRLYG